MENKLFSKVFMWMAIGLLVTFATAWFVSTNETMITNIFSKTTYILLIILEFAAVIYLSVRVMKMEPSTAKCVFLLYSVLSGLTFSSIFIYYQLSSIVYIFLLTSLFFGLLSLVGYFTKKDMTKIGRICIIGLIVVIITAIINVFVGSTMLDLILSILILILFIGITIYDIQKIKRLEHTGIPIENLAIYGALDLYLDFINIFIQLLRLFGRQK